MSGKPRGRRSANVLVAADLTVYAELVATALVAFSRDTAYSIDMARAAATIESKRNVWRQRLEARREQSSLV